MITININLAKDIWRNQIRLNRQPLLEKLDIEFIRSLESGDIEKQNLIKTQKQALRDAPSDPRIDLANSAEELLIIDPISDLGLNI